MLTFHYTAEQSATLISVIGVFNTIGMIFLGWTGDQPWLNIPKTYAICLVCMYTLSNSRNYSYELYQGNYTTYQHQLVYNVQ